MKKATIIIGAALLSSFVFQNCSSSKKVTAPATSFSRDIMPIMQASCTPCHFPPDGRKEPLNTIEAVKKNIDATIERVKLPKDDKRYMPFMGKKPALTTEQIALLEKWKADGMPE